MAKLVVAVSGGVDSVVLLDILRRGDDNLIVAHVDHGIRGEQSRADARFVRALAGIYNLPFVMTELNLGSDASEELARHQRYQFLFAVAREHGATLVTAHHQDDLVETVALNLTRGTGWRGLAVLARPDVRRPLLAMTKSQIYGYALEHRLEWVEDATNASDKYLRNRLRHRLAAVISDAERQRIVELRSRQLSLRTDIDREVRRLATNSRYFYTMADQSVALEVLRHVLADAKVQLTRPQLVRALHAIKTFRAGSSYSLSAVGRLDIGLRSFKIVV